MHELKATDVSEDVPDQPLRLRMNLINTLYSVQKLEGKSLPEPVIEYKVSASGEIRAQAAEEVTGLRKLQPNHMLLGCRVCALVVRSVSILSTSRGPDRVQWCVHYVGIWCVKCLVK